MAESEKSETLPTEIRCPGCRCRISSDGKSLVEESAQLVSLKAKAERLEELKADYAELRGRLKKLEGEVAAAPPAEPEIVPGPQEPHPEEERHFVIHT